MKKTPMPYPSTTRWFMGTTGIGGACGITWTLLLTGTYAQRYITKTHAIESLYALAFLLMFAQLWMLYRWGRRLKRDTAELQKEWDELGMQGTPPWKQ